MKRALLLALIVALCGCQDENGDAVATGTVEATEIDVAPLTSGRIVDLRVAEGDTVSPGDTVALLARTELPSQLETARARVDAARSRAAQVEHGPRQQEIAAARAQLRGAEADLTAAEKEFARVQQLVRDSMAAPRELERMEAARSLARSRRDNARETLSLLNAGARAEERQTARAEVKAAESAYDQVRAAAGDLVLISSAGGVVQLRNFEIGEVAAAGMPVVTLIDPRVLWVRVYVGQELLPQLKVGDRITVRADAFPDRTFQATITEIAPRAEFIPRVALTEQERADLVFAVKLRLDAGTGLRPGMSVDAVIPRRP